MFSTDGKRRCTLACLGSGAVTGGLLFLFLWLGHTGFGRALLTGLVAGAVLALVFFMLFCRGTGIAARAEPAVPSTAPPASARSAVPAPARAAEPAPSAPVASADDEAEAARANAAARAEMAAADEVVLVNHEASEAQAANDAAAAEIAAAEEVAETNLAALEAQVANDAAAAEIAAAEEVAETNLAALEAQLANDATAAEIAAAEEVVRAAGASTSGAPVPPAAGVAMTRPAGIDGPRGGKADDLKVIKGVGPKLETLLHSLGFYHFDQIAGWSDAEIAWVDEHLEGFRGRVTRDGWVAQARRLAAGGKP